MEVKIEADSNDITDINECSHDHNPFVGMFGFCDAVFSAFICLDV